MAKIKPDWSAYDVHSNKYHKTWHFITYLNLYCRYIQLFVELLFIYVFVRTCCHHSRKMASIFFILFTLRVVNDFIFHLVMEVNSTKLIKWLTKILSANSYFDVFVLEFDTFLHLVMCVNHFTAIMFPFAYNRIWNFRNNALILAAVVVVSGGCCYLDYQYFRQFDFIRAALCFICCVVLSVSICIRSKKNTGSDALIKKTDKQLLYDTIFTATVMVLTNVNYIFIDTNPYMSFKTFFVLASFDDFVYNSFFAVSIVFLFYISTAARDGLKLAIPLFSFWKPRNGQTRTAQNTTFTRVTAVETLSRALP